VSHNLSFGERIDALPDPVFARIIDVNALPDWNDAIPEVLESPAELSPGSVWKVRIRALGSSWVSRSEVRDLDRNGRRFAYRSQTDDGNPSYADWSWHVSPNGAGSRVEVTVDVHPRTFFRKHLIIRIRKPSLRKEMRTSLNKLKESFTAGT
jgi:hypothetical protein